MSNKPTNNVKDDVIILITTTLTFIIMLGVMWWQHNKINQYRDELYNRPVIRDTTTVEKRDTLWRDSIITSKPKVIHKTDTVFSDGNIHLLSKAFTDTITSDKKDTLTYTAKVTGYAITGDTVHPILDDITFRVKAHTITNTVTNTITNTVYIKEKEKFKLKIRPTIAVGYDPFRNQVSPTVGIGITY